MKREEDNPEIDEGNNWIGQGVAIVFALGIVIVFLALVIKAVKWILGF